MITLEFHAGDGGSDAELFASQLACAVGAHFNRPVESAGRVKVVHCL